MTYLWYSIEIFNYTSVDPKYWVLWIQWQAVECGAKACKPKIRGRVWYNVHCYREGSNHGAHATEIAINGSALQRVACHWEGTTYDANASVKVERGRNRLINKRQAAAGSLSTIIISTSSARTCNELHLPHMCFSINTRFVQAKYEHCV